MMESTAMELVGVKQLFPGYISNIIIKRLLFTDLKAF